jgi:hypothetical protein
MRAALAQVPGVRALWHDGGVVEDGGWAAVALSGPPEPLALAVARLRDTTLASAGGGLARAAERAFEHAERARAAALADPALEARLAQAEPVWLPLR